MLPAISPAVISHLAMPNSGVRRYAAALQSLVSAGANLLSAGIFAGVIAAQEFALSLSQLGTDGSNPSPSSWESGANLTFALRDATPAE